MAGRPRTPKSKKVLQGTFQACRNPKAEPEFSPPPESKQKPPKELNKWAKKYWNDQIDNLVDSGVMTEIDIPTFEMLCQCWGAYKEAEYDVYHDEEGKKRNRRAYRVQRGYNRRMMPELAEMKENWEHYTKLIIQFGMTPAAKNKIDLPEKITEVDPIEVLYKDKNG